VIGHPLTPGRLLYLFYHKPRAEISRSARVGGPYEQWLDWRGQADMQRAAFRLPPVPDFPGAPLVVHQLTGRRYLASSIFCFWTLAHTAQRTIAPIFHDDGSLRPAQFQFLKRIFPDAQLRRQEETLALMEVLLPPRRFPSLHERFRNYVHLRKLLAVHLGRAGWQLVLDADLLFFRRPGFLLDWLADPQQPLHLVDVADSYGYSSALLHHLAGGSLPERINVGACGLRSELIDWDLMEWWCSRLLRAEGSHYLLEQALTALLLRGTPGAAAPPGDYVVRPDRHEALAPTAALHHYVAESKRWYLRASWRISCEQFLVSAQQPG
jgi:hypothetical protein